MSSVFLQPNVSEDDCRRYSPLFWPVVVVAGLATGIAAGLLMLLLHLVQHVAFDYWLGDFLDGTRGVSWERRLLVVAGAGVVAASALAWFRRSLFFGGRTDINGAIWFHDGSLSTSGTSARALLSILLVGLGASLGREQAPKQIGSVLAHLGAARFGLRATEQRLLVACGAGAGVAAVYDVPFGGALFSLEVLLGTMALPLVAPALVMAAAAVLGSWLLLPDRATYSIPTHQTSVGMTVFALLAGPVLGLAAVAFTRGVAWTEARKPKGRQAITAPIAAFAALGLIGTALPGVLGNGSNLVQLCFDDGIAWPLLLGLALLKPLATIMCLSCGAPGGLFTPTIASGGLLGALAGHVIGAVVPGIDVADATLIGAAGMLAGTTLGPISSVVLVLELTRSGQAMLVPVLLVTAGAIVTARAIDTRTVYTARIHLGRSHAGENEGEISTAARMGEVGRMLLARPCGSESLVVVDERGEVVGRIDRHDVAVYDMRQRGGHANAVATAGDVARCVEETRHAS